MRYIWLAAVLDNAVDPQCAPICLWCSVYSARSTPLTRTRRTACMRGVYRAHAPRLSTNLLSRTCACTSSKVQLTLSVSCFATPERSLVSSLLAYARVHQLTATSALAKQHQSNRGRHARTQALAPAQRLLSEERQRLATMPARFVWRATPNAACAAHDA